MREAFINLRGEASGRLMQELGLKKMFKQLKFSGPSIKIKTE